ncbi:MAG: glycosyltransferase family 4 protein [Planctomycetota bacterium]|nr:MAG: glycosyltransferase family 4 protein [Planctomycetota bacterium]
MLAVFPQADVFSLIDFLPRHQRQFLAGKSVTTSFLQRCPFARRHYAAYLPLMPLAIEQLDLSGYEMVISSSHCVAKGVLTGPDQLHISYVHTPMRYAWDQQHEYLAHSGLTRGLRSCYARWMLHKLRLWDVRSSHGVDSFVANSGFIARRIEKTYRREARVIHPPVDTEAFTAEEPRENFYVTASRLVPYKRVDLLVEAFASMPDRRLIVVGDGSERKALAAKAPANVTLVGHQEFDALRSYLQRARGFVYAAQEDFGIVLAEAQAAGCPVIAYGHGGAAEIVRGTQYPQPTGVLFDQQTPEAVVAAIENFERQSLVTDAATCRAAAERFSAERFRREFHEHAMLEWQSFTGARQRRTDPTGETIPGTFGPRRVA